jgi:hypothetical protein
MGIVGALAAVLVEQMTGDIGVVDGAGVLVLVLGNAALGAAIAERLPLRRAHLLERDALPEEIAILIQTRLRRGPRVGFRSGF